MTTCQEIHEIMALDNWKYSAQVLQTTSLMVYKYFGNIGNPSYYMEKNRHRTLGFTDKA